MNSLIPWFSDALVRWFIDWMIHWIFCESLMIRWCIESSNHWLMASFPKWFTDSVIRWVIDSLGPPVGDLLIHWVAVSLLHWFFDSLTHWFIGSLTHCLIGSLIHQCLVHWLIHSVVRVFFHIISLASQQPFFSFAAAPHNFNTSFIASASQKLSYRPLMSYSRVPVSKLLPRRYTQTNQQHMHVCVCVCMCVCVRVCVRVPKRTFLVGHFCLSAVFSIQEKNGVKTCRNIYVILLGYATSLGFSRAFSMHQITSLVHTATHTVRGEGREKRDTFSFFSNEAWVDVSEGTFVESRTTSKPIWLRGVLASLTLAQLPRRSSMGASARWRQACLWTACKLPRPRASCRETVGPCRRRRPLRYLEWRSQRYRVPELAEDRSK